MQSFVSIRFSQHDRTVTQIPNTSSCALPSISHRFFDEKSFYKIFPLLPIVIAKSRLNASVISSRHVVFVRRLGDLVSSRKNANRGGVCKVFTCQKSMNGRWRGAWARAGWHVLDLGNGTIMLRKVNWDKILQKWLRFSDYRKGIPKQIQPSCRKTFRRHFVFVWFRESNEI